MGSGPGIRRKLRLPTWEYFLITVGKGMGTLGTPLSSAQRRVAQDIFQASIDVTRIRTKRTRIAGVGGTAAMVFGNTILVNPSQVLSGALLAHELTHVWQYQTTGARYLTDASLHRSYRVRVVPGRSMSHYEPEQQAVIVENYYLYQYQNKVVSSEFRKDNPDITATMVEVGRLIDEVRQRRPQPELMISEELNRALTGASANPRIPSPVDLSDRPRPVYQIGVRF